MRSTLAELLVGGTATDRLQAKKSPIGWTALHVGSGKCRRSSKEGVQS